MNVAGEDTIQGLVGKPPEVILLDYDTVRVAESLRQIWNKKFMAFIPYCYLCKVPLVWHSPPEEDHILFHCPKCDRAWKRDEKWIAKTKEVKIGKPVRCRIPSK